MGATASQPRASRGAKVTALPVVPAPASERSGEEELTEHLAATIKAAPEGAHLDAALLAIHAEAPALNRDGNAKLAGTSKGGRDYEYGYKFTTLDGVLDAITPLYAKWQVNFRARPSVDEHGQPTLKYRFTHIPSGEFEEDLYPLLLDKADSQGLGSAITYARRYIQLAVLNLAPGDDDDGAAAVRTINAAQSSAGATPAAQSGTRPASVGQRNMLRAKARDAGLSASRFADCLLSATGNEPRQMAEEAAERWLNMSLERFPGKKATMDAAIVLIEGGQS